MDSRDHLRVSLARLSMDALRSVAMSERVAVGGSSEDERLILARNQRTGTNIGSISSWSS